MDGQLRNYKEKNIYLSKALSKFSRIYYLYDLELYKNNVPCLFFGVYNDDNLNKMYSVNNYYNNAVFFQGNRLNHGASSIDNNKTRLVMVFFMRDIKYKYID